MATGSDGDAQRAERRRIVLHPRTALARRQDRARASGGRVRGYTVDTEDVMELVREQRRIAIRFFAAIMVPLITFAVALLLVPALGSWRPFGLPPLPWLLLGPVALFSIAGLAFVHERRANAVEARWAERRSDR